MDMNRFFTATIVATAAAVTVLSAAPKFTSVWRSPDAAAVSFAGKKVAALVITQDDSLRISGEESLVRELTARGLTSVATYRIAPKEELQSADRAKGWFEKAGIEGVVAMRPVSNDKRTTYNPGMWVSPAYSTFWGYYGYGWGGMYIPGVRRSGHHHRGRDHDLYACRETSCSGRRSARPKTRRPCSASSKISSRNR